LADYLHGIQGISLIQTDPGHIPGGNPNLGIKVQDTQEDVDIDQEMIRLTQNNLLYHANVQMLIKKLELLRAAMEGGK
jgi:flagellar basal-body rod protein FlgB